MKRTKLRIGVIMGGPSSEREISLITGKAVCENLDTKKYQVTPIEMTKDSRFIAKINNRKIVLDFVNKDRKRFDCIFIALHGTPGEDGTVQGMFEALQIPYTGPNTLSSALAMNKIFAAQVYYANGLPHPTFIHFKKDGWKNNRAKILADMQAKVAYPAVVKPADQGSAVGVSIVKNEAELIKAVEKTIKKFSWLMVQKFIKGREATCGVIEIEKKIMPLPPTRIVANLGEFYDYKSKYAKGGSTHICPADFSPEVNEKIQNLAMQAHLTLGCRGMSRTDIFVGDDDKLWVIETNTIPGMTPTSLFPEAAAKAGFSFAEVLDLIISASL